MMLRVASRRLAAATSAAPLRRGLMSAASGASDGAALSELSAAEVSELLITDHPANNVTANVASHVGRGLLHRPGHPLQIIKTLIGTYFYRKYCDEEGRALFSLFDDIDPVVTTAQCFDELLIPPDHARPSGQHIAAL